MDVNREAPVVVDLTIKIAAPPETVWRLHTDVADWPTWQPDITEVRLNGPIEAGSTFAWQTHGLHIVSTIAEVRPGTGIAWGGPAHGIDGVHVWAFTPTATGTLVRTTESWDGPPVTADPDGMRAALTASLTTWLAALKTAAETHG